MTTIDDVMKAAEDTSVTIAGVGAGLRSAIEAYGIACAGVERVRYARLREFAKGCLDEWPDVGMDGFDLQELAVKTGLLEAFTVTELCGENCRCIEYHGSDGFLDGVVCYRKNAMIRGEQSHV